MHPIHKSSNYMTHMYREYLSSNLTLLRQNKTCTSYTPHTIEITRYACATNVDLAQKFTYLVVLLSGKHRRNKKTFIFMGQG